MRYLLLIGALICCTNSWSDELNPPHKSVAQAGQKAEQKQSTYKIDTSTLEQSIRESIKEASKNADAHSDEKFEIDKKNSEYNRQLATYTDWLVVLTAALSIFSLWQVFISRDTARKQLRAHIGLVRWAFELAPIKPLKNANNSGQIHDNFLCATIQNFGQTAATDVVFVGCIANTPFGHNLPDNFDYYGIPDMQTIKGTGGFVSRFMLSPGQAETSKVSIRDPKAVQEIWNAKNKRASIYVWGRVYYRDIYGRHWRTKFCHAWEPWHSSGERFVPYVTHNGEDKAKLEDQIP